MKEKNSLHIWFDKDGNCPVTFLPEYIYNMDMVGSENIIFKHNDKPIHEKRKEINDDYNSILTDFFTIYKHNISTDIPDINHTNIILIPCIDILMLLNAVATIPKGIMLFCEKYNITIILNYVRECPSRTEREIINKYIDKFIHKKGYRSDNVKIIINAYKSIEENINSTFISVNMFDKFVYRYIQKKFKYLHKQYDFIEKRKYTFSVLFGQLHNRVQRVYFLRDCEKNNFINEKFFYSIICMNSDSTHKYVRDILCEDEYQAIKEYIYHKVYNNNGDMLKHNEHIYSDGFEYGIPEQVLNSYINIVLETAVDMPSVTEKLYKPLLCGVPFLWHGNRGVADHLVDQGYKLYPFIDYAFDSGETPEVRRNLLIKEMQRLQNIDLEYWVNSCKDISIYNNKNFLTQHYTINEIK